MWLLEGGRYTEDVEFEDIKLEDTDSDMDPTGIHSNRGKGIGEEEDRVAFHSLVSALNNLAEGQKEVLHAIDRLSLKARTRSKQSTNFPRRYRIHQ